MYQAGLVLEGGGMKGAYTAGILDFFLEKGLEFSSVYGVSAGACHMTNYLAKQKGRSLDIMLDYIDTKKYCSLESLMTTGDLFNVTMGYHLIPDYLNPYDYEAFRRYKGKAYSVATDIKTGYPEYFRIKDMKKDIDKIRPSASLPLVSRNVKIDNHLYLDGGISDAIPIMKSIVDGNRKNIVILTKEEGYVRQPTKHLELLKMRYFKYENVYKLMKNRHNQYNATIEYLEKQQENGQAFVIRPSRKSNVKRVEKNPDKLRALYEEGYQGWGEELRRYDELFRVIGMEKEMLEILKAIVFGIVEGITEWLPISSTGHLILVEEFIHFNGVSEGFWDMFEVVIQLGAILAVVLLFFKKIWPFCKKGNGYKQEGILAYVNMDILTLWFKILVACVPAAVIGLAFDDILDALFYHWYVVAGALIIFGIAFILVENWNKGKSPKVSQLGQITYQMALLIGVFQLLAAVFPGTSRSGATIIGALLIGVSRKVAAEFTFFLAIPVMFGASLLKVVKFGFHFTGLEAAVLITGMLVAFVVSVIVIKFLLDYIKKHDFKVFGWYRIILGIIVIIYFGFFR